MADEYVLGTHDQELARLGLQHRVWRRTVLDCWQRAGITLGSRVLDVGAGPGYATLDLAEIVGPTGNVLAVERSERFLAALRGACRARGLDQVRAAPVDLMKDYLPAENFDFSWCRWVLCFLADPERVVRELHSALRPRGRAIFHEYAEYATWNFLPPRPRQTEFVALVEKSWRESGGEPNLGRELPRLLTRNGFRMISVEPRIFALTPGDYMWEWPATFIESGAARLQELGYMSATAAEELRAEFAAATREAAVYLLTPLVLEVVAEKID